MLEFLSTPVFQKAALIPPFTWGVKGPQLSYIFKKEGLYVLRYITISHGTKATPRGLQGLGFAVYSEQRRRKLSVYRKGSSGFLIEL